MAGNHLRDKKLLVAIGKGAHKTRRLFRISTPKVPKLYHDVTMLHIFQVAGSHIRYKNVAVASGKEAEEKKALPLVRDFFLLSFTKQ